MSSNVAGHVSRGSLIRRADSHLPTQAGAGPAPLGRVFKYSTGRSAAARVRAWAFAIDAEEEQRAFAHA